MPGRSTPGRWAGCPRARPGRAAPGPPPARRGTVALAPGRAGLHPGCEPPRDRPGCPGPRQLQLALEGRLGRRGVGAVLRGEPALHPRFPALGDGPVPLHLDQPDLALRLPGLGHPAHPVGARPGHGDHVRGDRLGRLPRQPVGGRAQRGPADGHHVLADGLACAAAPGRGPRTGPGQRRERAAADHAAPLPAGRLAPAAHAHHDRAGPRRAARPGADRPDREARHPGRGGRADPAAAAGRAAAGHRGLRGPGLPPPRADRPGRLHDGRHPSMAADRGPAVAGRPPRRRHGQRRPGTARPRRGRAAGERRPAHL